METTGVTISPVNQENRRSIGVKAGDTVRVHQKIHDKGKTRIQVFEGLVLARKHGNEPGATFTVRKVVDGIGVEKIFPLYSPMIDKIEITRRSKVRRAKLYYIREKVAREIKRQMRRMHMTELATESDIEAAAKAEAKEKETAAQEEPSEVKEETAAPETEAQDEPTTEASKKKSEEPTTESDVSDSEVGKENEVDKREHTEEQSKEEGEKKEAT